MLTGRFYMLTGDGWQLKLKRRNNLKGEENADSQPDKL